MTDYIPKTEPFQHQAEVFELSRNARSFALLMEQGTGKTKVAIDTAAWLYSIGKIDALVVIAPNGVHRNWVVNEIPAHLPDYVNRKLAIYRAPSSSTRADKTAYADLWEKGYMGLRIWTINVEAFSHKQAAVKTELKKFLNAFRCMVVMDESSKIKTPGAKRTMSVTNLCKFVPYKRILNGTLISKSPLDAFSQFRFLSTDLLGYQTFSEFRSQFAVTEPRKQTIIKNGVEREVKYDEVVGYRNLDQLRDLILPHSFRVRKTDCLDLPEKVYRRRLVELSPEQKRMYQDMLKESVAKIRLAAKKAGEELPPGELTPEQQLLWFLQDNIHSVVAPNAAVRVMRLQQILGGFIPGPEDGEVVPIPGPNHRLTALLSDIEQIDGKVIIWARFRAEIEAINRALLEEYGEGSSFMYYGGTKQRDRDEGVDAFQNDPGGVRFFVGQTQSGGYGITLHAAQDMFYYSNDRSVEGRLQSEDRAHRIGMRGALTITDLEVEGSMDTDIMTRFKEQQLIAAKVLDS